MPPRSLMSSLVLASMAAVPLFATPTAVQAQGLIDFLWGGSKEYGGGSQTVSFDPKYTPGQIIVSFSDRRLYLLTKKGQAISYPIAVPREKSRWQGTTTITAKRENPSWRPTQEMLSENPKLPHWVPGGHPMNPLGVRALYLGTSAYRIHGTDAPWTIGQAVSQGCIRMINKDVLDLFPRVPIGTRVTVTWERFTTDASVASADDAQPYEPASQPSPITVDQVSDESVMPPLPKKAPAMPGFVAKKDEGKKVEKSKAATASATDGLPQDFIPVDDEGRAVARKKSTERVPQTTAKKDEAKKDPVKKAEAAPKPETAKPQKVAKASEPKVEKPKAAAQTKVDAPKAEAPKAEAKAEAKAEPAKPAMAQSEPAAKAAADDATHDIAANAAKTARRAAEAAARAAEMAREAAEAARKAAADAKKATSASNAPAKPATAPGKPAPGKSASL